MLYETITKTLIARRLTISTMESCTSGLIASLISDTEGASAVMPGAFVTYCNEAKIAQGVPAETIERFGVYSAETALAMAAACKAVYKTDLGVGVTGSLGRPDPANPDSVPGEAYIAADYAGKQNAVFLHLAPCATRFEGKLQIAAAAAELIVETLKGTAQ